MAVTHIPDSHLEQGSNSAVDGARFTLIPYGYRI